MTGRSNVSTYETIVAAFATEDSACARHFPSACVAPVLRRPVVMDISKSEDSTSLELVDQVRDASSMIASGIGIGVLGAAAAAISGAVCPVCIVAVPALVGAGAYKCWRARRQR